VAPGAGRHGGFGVYVEALRRARNLAQGELARSLGMKTPQYRALLKHPVPPPDFETVVRIVRLLDADPLEAAMRAWGMAPEEAAQVMESEYPDVWRSRRVGQPPIAKSRVWDAG
jgi:transcriptional regulator with XRE-family HTH domain